MKLGTFSSSINGLPKTKQNKQTKNNNNIDRCMRIIDQVHFKYRPENNMYLKKKMVFTPYII